MGAYGCAVRGTPEVEVGQCNDNDDPRDYASPPCFLHELDPAYCGIADAGTEVDVARWRKAERARLIAARQAIPVSARASAAVWIGEALDAHLGDLSGQRVGLYWPFKGEPDLRGWAERQRAYDAQFCLPVVVRKFAPLVFRDWSGQAPLERGVWNIPIPPASEPEVIPDVVIAPVVGFDAAGFRLGYGGGYYDRTLAALHQLGHAPRVIGVGFEIQRIPTIYPQPYDIALDGAVLAKI
jgi:5,10-methenyltetrahydrofolate synthetase